MTHPPRELVLSEGGRIAVLIVDGLGGLPLPGGGSELEQAEIPNLDALARRSSAGRLQLLPTGLTPGSGPGHLSLFGYDPMTLEFGRGLLEALGSDYPLSGGEVAARGNFCTLAPDGSITDRRAGRPPSEECVRLCELLAREVSLEGASLELLPGKEHRFTAVIGGAGLGARVNDNDPQIEGKEPLPFRGADDISSVTAELANSFFAQARAVLRGEERANGILLRGFSTRPALDPFIERFKLRAAGVAVYPMYRGAARLVGMDIIEPGVDLGEQLAAVERAMPDYDYFFIHTKPADAAGHSGDFDSKIAALEEVDRHIPTLEGLGFDVIAITGDHSTPCIRKEHSWHPVPLLIHSRYAIPVPEVTFDERGVLRGDLGVVRGPELMALLLAHADRLAKYGA
ncbi:MAG: 2,3-bisphosphoglycerate-independent phosphoglycerate mutase [Planctomycetota bacterium]